MALVVPRRVPWALSLLSSFFFSFYKRSFQLIAGLPICAQELNPRGICPGLGGPTSLSFSELFVVVLVTGSWKPALICEHYSSGKETQGRRGGRRGHSYKLSTPGFKMAPTWTTSYMSVNREWTNCGINTREYYSVIKKKRASLAVQWIRLHDSTAGSTGSIPGQGIKILHAA